MSKNVTKGLAAAAIAATMVAGPSLAFGYGSYGSYGDSSGGSYDGGSRGGNLSVIGLAGGKDLYQFSTDDPGRTSKLGTVPLAGDVSLVGIDFRVQNGKLYGVGNAGGIYLINKDSAAATKVGQLSVALNGVNFGVDFNPAANALRVISDTGQNLRQPFPAAVNGVFSDGPAPATGTATDTALTTNGAPTSGVTGAAYTNNDLDASTATTLFDLNTTNDTVVIQSPANAGLLVATGNLGVDFAPNSGFDIYSKVRPMNTGKAVEAFPYAVSNGNLYEINLLNGQAALEGALGTPAITDIAIPLNQL